VPEYAVAVLALGAARAWLFPAVSPATGHALWLVVVVAVTGTFFVVPTAGEIPIIATLAVSGLGPAASGALLIALPAVSLPSLLMVGRPCRPGSSGSSSEPWCSPPWPPPPSLRPAASPPEHQPPARILY
jgi:hypothetical protein